MTKKTIEKREYVAFGDIEDIKIDKLAGFIITVEPSEIAPLEGRIRFHDILVEPVDGPYIEQSITPDQRIIGVIPVNGKAVLGAIYKKGVFEAIEILGYEFEGISHPNWVEELKSRETTEKEVNQKIKNCKE